MNRAAKSTAIGQFGRSGGNSPMQRWLRSPCLWALLVVGTASLGELSHAADDGATLDEATRRSAAVALNYSRAALHRIRQNPSMRVLYEEQDKILNHLNLNGIADEEVLKLYTSVLDEITEIQLADREREFVQEKYRRQFQKDLAVNAMALATEVMTAQYAAAVRTGCNSWWDFRSQTHNRELDLHRVEKERLTKLVEKSAKFLDVSWKMARSKQIPDRWLVRGDDLDKLEEALHESDATVRQRVLKRMEPFMECYPPYWYYVARTYQSTGQLLIAADTYQRLSEIGRGHFRKDEMLAAGLANRSLIQAFLGQPGAAETARQALGHSTDVWEANLICACVLQRNRCFDEAEDAILRNLDVNLERSQSQLALVALLYQADDRTRLAGWLSDPAIVREMPALLLVQCATKLGETHPLPHVSQAMLRSLYGLPKLNRGRDDLVIHAGNGWQLGQAQLSLRYGDQIFRAPRTTVQPDGMLVTFEGVAEWGSTVGDGQEPKSAVLVVQYPQSAPIELTLQLTLVEPINSDLTTPLLLSSRRMQVFRLSAMEQDAVQLTWSTAGFRPVRKGEIENAAGQVDGRPRAVPVGNTTLKPATEELFLTTPPIEVPAVPPLR
jgi:hypothetical protein